jgi:hypothetical protein
VNFEPNKLALLISLICAGAPSIAFSKTEGATERPGSTREVCDWVRDLGTPQAWPLILNGVRDADACSLGLSLPVTASRAVQAAWQPTELRKVDAATVHADDALTAPPAFNLEPVDPMEAANASSPIVSTTAQPSTAPELATSYAVMPESPSAQPAAGTKRDAETLKAIAPLQLVELRLEDAVIPRAELVITPSAQRVMRSLAAVRFPALETVHAVVESAVAPTQPAPTLEPTASAKVLVTLDQVLTPPNVEVGMAMQTATTGVSAATEDEPRLEDAIAARQEIKRMRQRARAEEAALAQAARAQTQTHTQTQTQTQTPRGNPFGSERLAVRDTALDTVRGGFVTNNLNIAFGIERAVYINGALVTTTSLNITDTGRITSSTDTKGLTPSTLALIQSGAGNSVAGGAFSSASGVGLNANAIGTVVQNTLDGQKIQNVTVINATANSLGVLRELNLQNSLRSSLIDSLRR